MSMTITPEFLENLMTIALSEAEKALAAGEVPVGAVIAQGERIVSRSHNQTESDRSVSSHAEMIAIGLAGKSLGNWRLNECVLCVTLEPCTMCLGAIRLSRLPTLIFGAGDSKQGAVGSLYDLSDDPRLGPPLRVIQGIQQPKCEALLREFFAKRRM